MRVDAEKKLAYADGGALWGTVNNETMKYGLATTGGTVSHACRFTLLRTPTLADQLPSRLVLAGQAYSSIFNIRAHGLS